MTCPRAKADSGCGSQGCPKDQVSGALQDVDHRFERDANYALLEATDDFLQIGIGGRPGEITVNARAVESLLHQHDNERNPLGLGHVVGFQFGLLGALVTRLRKIAEVRPARERKWVGIFSQDQFVGEFGVFIFCGVVK